MTNEQLVEVDLLTNTVTPIQEDTAPVTAEEVALDSYVCKECGETRSEYWNGGMVLRSDGGPVLYGVCWETPACEARAMKDTHEFLQACAKEA